MNFKQKTIKLGLVGLIGLVATFSKVEVTKEK